MLSACSTIGGVVDAVNPFDETEKERLEAEGEVADDTSRISILELSDTLTVGGSVAPGDVVLPAAYVNTDWPQVGGNTQNVVQHTGASGNLDKAWSKDIGKASGRKSRVLAPPVIAAGVIYTMDGDNRVTAIEEASGKELWDYKVSVNAREKTRKGKTGIVERIRDPRSFFDGSGEDKESVGGGVAYGDGKIFISSGLGVMTALDATTGEYIWSTPTRTPLHSGPSYDNGRVFSISDDNELFAFNAFSGEVIWTYQGIIESARMLTVPSPAIKDDVIVAPFSSGELVALQVQNGGVLWQDALSSSARLTPLATLNDIAAGPVIVDGYVIATAQSGVMTAFDFRTGQRVWSQPAGSIGMPLVAGDFVYTVTTDSKVACLSKLDGSVAWIQPLKTYKKVKKKKGRVVWSGPILASDRLFLASSEGRTVTISPYDGSILSEGKIGDPVFVPPVIANETVYVVTDKAKLVALR